MQAYIDGLPIFTLGVYGWSSGQCGIMIGILGLVAPIINTGVGAFSARLPDRHITVSSPGAFYRSQNHDDGIGREERWTMWAAICLMSDCPSKHTAHDISHSHSKSILSLVIVALTMELMPTV